METSEPETFIDDWPGKSAAVDGIEHPAAYHMLDVAAAAERLIAPTGLPRPLERACVLLVCLHDLGKMTPSFRAMLREGAPQARRHWEWSELLLQEHDAALANRLGGDRSARFALYAAVAGHHGRPPGITAGEVTAALRGIDADARADSGSFIAAVAELWPGASLEGLTPADARGLSWWLAGLTTAADWVGSNTGWFPVVPSGPSPADYMSGARERAAVAVAEAGLDPARTRDGVLFDFALRPMQAACAKAALPPGPTLAIIEDETGAGKTEAAMILAQRMVLAGRGAGLFLAMPTMATSDAMFARAWEIVGGMFDAPSVTLAHGRSALSAAFREVAPRGAIHDRNITQLNAAYGLKCRAIVRARVMSGQTKLEPEK